MKHPHQSADRQACRRNDACDARMAAGSARVAIPSPERATVLTMQVAASTHAAALFAWALCWCLLRPLKALRGEPYSFCTAACADEEDDPVCRSASWITLLCVTCRTAVRRITALSAAPTPMLLMQAAAAPINSLGSAFSWFSHSRVGLFEAAACAAR